MKYGIGYDLRKIKSNVEIVFPDGSRKSYKSGEEASDDQFEKRYGISELTADNNKIEITVEELPIMAEVNWKPKEDVSFF